MEKWLVVQAGDMWGDFQVGDWVGYPKMRYAIIGLARHCGYKLIYVFEEPKELPHIADLISHSGLNIEFLAAKGRVTGKYSAFVEAITS